MICACVGDRVGFARGKPLYHFQNGWLDHTSRTSLFFPSEKLIRAAPSPSVTITPASQGLYRTVEEALTMNPPAPAPAASPRWMIEVFKLSTRLADCGAC